MSRSSFRCAMATALLLAAGSVRAAAADPSPASGDQSAHALLPLPGGNVPTLPGRRQKGSGTGFVVAPTTVLTNAHVMQSCGAVTGQIGGAGAELLTLEPGPLDEPHDLALLTLPRPAPAVAAFEADTARIDPGELAVVGFPTVGMPMIRPSLITAATTAAALGPDRELIEFQGKVHPGNSGSPLFDGYGAVIGIVSMKLDSAKVYQRTGATVLDVGFARSRQEILRFLQANRIRFEQRGTGARQNADTLMAAASRVVVRLACWE